MSKRNKLTVARQQRVAESCEVLRGLGFGSRQCNEVAGYTLLALAALRPADSWASASAPYRGITPIIEFIHKEYGVRYAPNTRETIRDEAVKHFVEAGLVLRNPDNLARPTNSGKTVYQMVDHAIQLLRTFQTRNWSRKLSAYLASREQIRNEIERTRSLARIHVRLPSGKAVSISPGGQNPLIKVIIEEFCPRGVAGGVVVYIGDAENKFLHLDADYLAELGIAVAAPAKMPDVVVHDPRRNWLVLIEAVTSAGPIDGKRRKELKELFGQSSAGLVFVTAFESREAMRSFLSRISLETEVWVADGPDHLIHFDGERFLGPYADSLPQTK